MLKTASRALLERLAEDRRRVFAAWRALVLLRRATLAIPARERRWLYMPKDIYDITPVLRQMKNHEEIVSIRGLAHIFQVTVPYASSEPLNEFEILMEVHPYAALSHISALVYHGLTDDLPKYITMLAPAKRPLDLLPPGTVAEDWEELQRVSGTKPPRVLDLPVRWTTVKTDWFFGVNEYHRYEFPVRVTDRERTLLDGLRSPELSGGLENVLRAWVLSRDVLDIDSLVRYVERFNIAVLRQRVGFVLESLHLLHPVLEKWRAMAQRGGSSKLLTSAPYSLPGGPTVSVAWNLSLNAPIKALEEFSHDS